MIALNHQLPYLQTGFCIFADYDELWLQELLHEAALRAGVQLHFQQEIAAAIIAYLRTYVTQPSLSLQQLFHQIRQMLIDLGLDSIAEQLRVQTPPVEIALDGIAAELPFPLFFYSELLRRMKELREKGLHHYRFSGIERCCLILEQRHRACAKTKEAKHELQAFLNHSLSAAC